MLKSTMLANEALFYYYRSNCMSRLENHAMLRDAATDVFTVCSSGEIWLGRNRGSFFRGKLIF